MLSLNDDMNNVKLKITYRNNIKYDQRVPISATIAWRKARETPSPTTDRTDALFSPRYDLICRRKLDTCARQHQTSL